MNCNVQCVPAAQKKGGMPLKESFQCGGQEDWKSRLRIIAADIAAMILFSTAMCMAIEVFVAGLTLFQSLQARAAAIPVNLLTGRPYGWFRDRLFRLLRIDASRPLKMILGDTLAFLVFQVPLYVAVLLLAGATWSQIALSSLSMSILFSIAGRPYGVFLEFCRKLAGVPEKGTE